MPIDSQRRPARLLKVLRTYLNLLRKDGSDPTEDIVLQELVADVCEWIGHPQTLRKTLVAAEQAYQERVLGEMAKAYQSICGTTVAANIEIRHDFQHDKRHLAAIGGEQQHFTDPHRFIQFYRQLIVDCWYPRLFMRLGWHDSGRGELCIEVRVTSDRNAASGYLNMSSSVVVATIERGPKRLFGLLQEITYQFEADPPKPVKPVDVPQKALREIDISKVDL